MTPKAWRELKAYVLRAQKHAEWLAIHEAPDANRVGPRRAQSVVLGEVLTKMAELSKQARKEARR